MVMLRLLGKKRKYIEKGILKTSNVFADSSCCNNGLMVISTEMAENSTPAPSAPSAEQVGNLFVEQYYDVLLSQPDLAYKFYEESSVLGRPSPDGHMVKATTMEVSFFTRVFMDC